MERKLIFLDVDGTILIPDEGIRQTVKDGLLKARANGHQVFISTGRAICCYPEELKDIELDGVLASAGSDIWIHGKNVYRASIDPASLQRIMDKMQEIHAVYMLEGYETIYVSESGAGLLLGSEPLSADNAELARWKAFFSRLKNVEHIEKWILKKSPIPKVTFMIWGKENMEALRLALQDKFDVAVFPQKMENFFNGEVIPKTCNKGTAIHKTAELLGANFADTVAFGDSMNDYQMIEQAALGIVMENGDEKLKAIADRICESVWEDGVIRELERMHII